MFERIAVTLLLLAVAAQAQERKTRIDVDRYAIDADINQRTQSLAAKAAIKFTPLDDNTSSVAFELNNALTVSKVMDQQNRQIPASRSQQDFTVHLNFNEPLEKGKPVTVTFFYDGRLSGQEDSPVYGIKFAAIQNDFAYLMYPARWFPINDYTIDRYTADLHITVPAAFKVLSSGLEKSEHVGADKMLYSFQFTKPSFPGSIALVQGEPQRV